MLERNQIISLSSLLIRLLHLNDTNFSNFLNSDPKVLRALVQSLLVFTSSAPLSVSRCFETQFVDFVEINHLHNLLFKFLLRLCPAFNSLHKKELKSPSSTSSQEQGSNSNTTTNSILKAVRPPKRFLDLLFESDPLGLLLCLHSTWHRAESYHLDIIRDELVPQSFLDKLRSFPVTSQNKSFINWLTESTSVKSKDLSLREKENIIKRFEYESDDDMVEEDSQQQGTNSIEKMDPIQIHLLTAYISNPTLFSRTSACRSSPSRKELLQFTKLSHEQVEGWAVMFERNPKKMRIIQDFYILKTFQQNNK